MPDTPHSIGKFRCTMKVDPPGQMVVTFVNSAKEGGGTIIARIPTDKAKPFEPGKTYEFFGKLVGGDS